MAFATLSQTIFTGHTPTESRFAKKRSDGTASDPIFAFICQNVVYYFRKDALGVWMLTNQSVPAPGTQLISLMWPEYADDITIPTAYIHVGATNKDIMQNAVNSPSLPPAPIVPTPFIFMAFTLGIPWRMDYHSNNLFWGVGEASPFGRYTAFGPGSGTVVQSIQVHTDWVTGMQYSTALSLKVMCTCSLDSVAKVFGKINYFDFGYLHTMVPIYSPPKPHPPCTDLEQVAIASFALYTLIGCEDGDIQMFEPTTNLFLGTYNTGSPVNSVTGKTLSHTAQVIAAAACHDGIHIVNMDTGTLIQHIQVIQAGVPIRCNCVDWNWDGTQLVSAWHDFNIRVHTTL